MLSSVAANARIHIMLGLSVVLHSATLAGLRPLTITPPRLVAFEPIEVALIGDQLPRVAHAAERPPATPVAPPAPTSNADATSRTEPLPAALGAGVGARSEDALVEARADVAALNNPKPAYPLAARRRGIEGRVLVSAHVHADGVCTEVRLKRSSGHSLLDESALDAVRRWRFLPARRVGAPIDAWVDVPVSFRLDG